MKMLLLMSWTKPQEELPLDSKLSEKFLQVVTVTRICALGVVGPNIYVGLWNASGIPIKYTCSTK